MTPTELVDALISYEQRRLTAAQCGIDGEVDYYGHKCYRLRAALIERVEAGDACATCTRCFGLHCAQGGDCAGCDAARRHARAVEACK